MTSPGRADVRVLDAAGRLVAELVDARQPAGEHAVGWNTSDVPNGVYYCTLRTPDGAATRPLVVNH